MDLPGGGEVFVTVPETTSCHQLVQCNTTDIALRSTIVAKCMFQILGYTFKMQTASLCMRRVHGRIGKDCVTTCIGGGSL